MHFLDADLDIQAARMWWKSSTHLSLKTLLKTQKFKSKEKYLLMLLLSTALWQFYGTEWHGVPWTISDIYFLTENRGSGAGVFLDEPFIVPSHQKDPVKSSSPERRKPRSSQLEPLRALGIVLLELELGKPMDEMIEKESQEDDWSNINIHRKTLFTAVNLLRSPSIMSDIPLDIQEVIKNCLQPDIFQNYTNDPEALRGAFKREILMPLCGVVEVWYEDPFAGEVRGPILSPNSSGDCAVELRCVFPLPIAFFVVGC